MITKHLQAVSFKGICLLKHGRRLLHWPCQETASIDQKDAREANSSFPLIRRAISALHMSGNGDDGAADVKAMEDVDSVTKAHVSRPLCAHCAAVTASQSPTRTGGKWM